MIVREFLRTRKDNVNLYRTYSDSKHFIKKVGTNEVYTEAVDVEDAPYEYEETNDLIPEKEEKGNEEKEIKETSDKK
jgi:hypothetical protein